METVLPIGIPPFISTVIEVLARFRRWANGRKSDVNHSFG